MMSLAIHTDNSIHATLLHCGRSSYSNFADKWHVANPHFQILLTHAPVGPGLVFPSFASTKAEMVCYGILPIDQLTGYIEPMQYIANCIPRATLNYLYGIAIIAPGGIGSPLECCTFCAFPKVPFRVRLLPLHCRVCV